MDRVVLNEWTSATVLTMSELVRIALNNYFQHLECADDADGLLAAAAADDEDTTDVVTVTIEPAQVRRVAALAADEEIITRVQVYQAAVSLFCQQNGLGGQGLKIKCGGLRPEFLNVDHDRLTGLTKNLSVTMSYGLHDVLQMVSQHAGIKTGRIVDLAIEEFLKKLMDDGTGEAEIEWPKYRWIDSGRPR